MGRAIAGLLLCVPAWACAATALAEGRWEGQVRIPDRTLAVVMDLSQDPAGKWTGSIIFPALGIKGSPLSGIVATGSDLVFDLGDSLTSPTYGPATFRIRLSGADAMSGDMRQGGNVAQFSAARIGPAQVELPPRSTPVGPQITAAWAGDFELGGYPRHVTITIENHADAAATASFIVVGKQTTNLPVDLVIEDGNFLRIESNAAHAAFEGRYATASGEIRGVVELGELELPMVLRRSTGSAS